MITAVFLTYALLISAAVPAMCPDGPATSAHPDPDPQPSGGPGSGGGRGRQHAPSNVDDSPGGFSIRIVDNVPTTVQSPCKALQRETCAYNNMHFEELPADNNQPAVLDAIIALATLEVRIAEQSAVTHPAMCTPIAYGTTELTIRLLHMPAACAPNCTSSMDATRVMVASPADHPLAVGVCNTSGQDILPVFPDSPDVGANITVEGKSMQLIAEFNSTLLVRVIGPARRFLGATNVSAIFIDDFRNSTACHDLRGPRNDVSVDAADLSPHTESSLASPSTAPDTGRFHVRLIIDTHMIKASVGGTEALPDQLHLPLGAASFWQGDGSCIKTSQAVRLLSHQGCEKAFLCAGYGRGMGFFGEVPTDNRLKVLIGCVVGSVVLFVGLIVVSCIVCGRMQTWDRHAGH